MKISAKSDKGMVRANNQDSYATGELPGNVAWAVVCDGMGGAAGGNVASATAVKRISETIATCFHADMSDLSVRNLLMSAVESANAEVYEKAQENETLRGMGTTVVAVIAVLNRLYIVSVGDSRVYLISDELRQITTDHSLVQTMVDRGELTKEEAAVHPKKNVITRALGVEPDVRVDFFQEAWNPETDLVLLCTDGLTNFVGEDELMRIAAGADKYEIANQMVDAANANGGGDNVTVVTVSNEGGR